MSQFKIFLAEHQPEMIIHAAGVVGGIQANMADPVKFLVDNMQMGLNILTSEKSCATKRFLNLSSSCMYPRAAQNPLSETLILKGELEPTNEGYALAKIATTRLCKYINQEQPELLFPVIYMATMINFQNITRTWPLLLLENIITAKKTPLKLASGVMAKQDANLCMLLTWLNLFFTPSKILILCHKT
jgi:hypothetical protein